MSEAIDIVDVQAQPMASIAARLSPSDIPEKTMALTDKVWAFLRAESIGDHGHNVWLYRPAGDGQMDVEVGVQVASPFPTQGEVVCSYTPRGRAVHAVHYGDYNALPGVYQAVMDWCAKHGHETAGVGWEVYGDWHDDPAQRRTDVYYLLRD